MIKNIEKMFLRAINPWGKYPRLYETNDEFITNSNWAVRKEILDRYNLPYRDYLISKWENRTIRALYSEIVDFRLEVFKDIQFSLAKKVRVDGKTKTVYYFDSEELRGILMLKIYADFLCALCRSNPTLIITKVSLGKYAYFAWYEDTLIALCAGIIENQ
jgi:hypothetical protein